MFSLRQNSKMFNATWGHNPWNLFQLRRIFLIIGRLFVENSRILDGLWFYKDSCIFCLSSRRFWEFAQIGNISKSFLNFSCASSLMDGTSRNCGKVVLFLFLSQQYVVIGYKKKSFWRLPVEFFCFYLVSCSWQSCTINNALSRAFPARNCALLEKEPIFTFYSNISFAEVARIKTTEITISIPH